MARHGSHSVMTLLVDARIQNLEELRGTQLDSGVAIAEIVLTEDGRILKNRFAPVREENNGRA